MDVAELLADPPLVHRGGRHVWALAEKTLRYIDRSVAEHAVTLETGLGASTVLFALKGADHTCICPDGAQVQRLIDYCVRKGIDHSRVRFIEEFSENVLPTLDIREIDLSLIDGGHGFPTPWIDWYYIAGRLRAGGVVIVDDTQIWTGHVLDGFLRRQPGWEAIDEDLGLRASAFRMVAPFTHSEWTYQPYVTGRSRWTRLAYQYRTATDLALRGEFGRLVRGARRTLAARFANAKR